MAEPGSRSALGRGRRASHNDGLWKPSNWECDIGHSRERRCVCGVHLHLRNHGYRKHTSLLQVRSYLPSGTLVLVHILYMHIFKQLWAHELANCSMRLSLEVLSLVINSITWTRESWQTRPYLLSTSLFQRNKASKGQLL